MKKIDVVVGKTYRISNGDFVRILAQEDDGDYIGITKGLGCYVRMVLEPPVVYLWCNGRDVGTLTDCKSCETPVYPVSNYCALWWNGFQHGYDCVDNPPSQIPNHEAFVYWNGFRCGVAMRDEAQKSGNVMKNNSRDMEY